MGKWARSARQRWLAREVAPRLDIPAHWTSTGMVWGSVDFGLIGTPSGWIAQGLGVVPSRLGPWFDAHIIVMPLYCPVTEPYISYGLKLTPPSGKSNFEIPSRDSSAVIATALADMINEQGVPFLEKTGLLVGYRDHLKEHQDWVLQHKGAFVRGDRVGYSTLLLGELEDAEAQLSRASIPDPEDAEWETRNREQCALVLASLREDAESAKQLLATWASESALALGVRIQDADELLDSDH